MITRKMYQGIVHMISITVTIGLLLHITILRCSFYSKRNEFCLVLTILELQYAFLLIHFDAMEQMII